MTASNVITGTLEAYWEQGMEGRIEYAFSRDDRPNEPFFLVSGQYLRIFAEDGAVLWEGVLNLVSRHGWLFSQKHDLPNGIWNDHTQQGVSYKTWIRWFWHKPPLRAELIPSNG